jgi:DNA repair exonuclease SbcCD ATPase subunit
MAKLINLRVTSILGIRHADLDLGGESVIIGGKNGSGKSSLQQAAKMALGGKDWMPERPVTDGEKKGKVEADVTHATDAYRIEATVTADRKLRLKITKPGEPDWFSDSVTLLKDMFGALSFDPGEWLYSDAHAKLVTLQQLAGIDFSAVNEKRAQVFEARTVIGRNVRRLDGQLAGLPFDKTAPANEQNAAEVALELGGAREAIAKHKATLNEAAALRRQADGATAEAHALLQEIERLTARREEALDKAEKLYEKAAAKAKNGDKFTRPDVESLEKRLASIDAVNAAVRGNERHTAVWNELANAKAEQERLTDELQKIDEGKAVALGAAKLPVEGLGFDEQTILYNDR